MISESLISDMILVHITIIGLAKFRKKKDMHF